MQTPKSAGVRSPRTGPRGSTADTQSKRQERNMGYIVEALLVPYDATGCGSQGRDA